MNVSINRLAREPLIHFLLIGVAIFMLYSFTRDVGSESPNRIVVSKGQQEQLAANFKRTWLRSPTKAELAGLVDNLVREEVFYREAMAMGLDQDDPMVRQRMRMKLEFILEDLSTQAVTDDNLIAFLQKHPDKFRSEAQLSFQQVYLDTNKHKDIDTFAKSILTRLSNGVAPDSVGDSTFAPYEYNLTTQRELTRTLGEQFANEAIKLSPGDWVGPIYSAYGAHLLKVSERIEASQPALAEIRELVKREYLVAQKQAQKDLAYQKLRGNYDVIFEPVPSVPTLGGETVATAQATEAQ